MAADGQLSSRKRDVMNVKDEMNRIVSRIITNRDDIPPTFSFDGDLAEQALELLAKGKKREAEDVVFYAICKEYGYQKPAPP